MRRLGTRRHTHIAILTLAAIGGTAGVGCDDRSIDAVAEHSIVDLDEIDTTQPLQSNGDFERSLNSWVFELPQGMARARDPRVRHTGKYSLRLRARRAGVRGLGVVLQEVGVLTETDTGTQYRLSLWARTENLNRAIEVELKLTYADDTYQFFRGGLRGRNRGGIPPGTAPWREFEVIAGAEKPVTSIQIFAIDSGEGPLQGKIWIDDVELRAGV